MPGSTAKYNALKQISTILCSGSELGNPFDLVLELTRKTIGAQATALFRIEGRPPRLIKHCSFHSSQSSLAKETEGAAMLALDGGAPDAKKGVQVQVLSTADGERVVLVCEAVGEADDGFLKAVLGQIVLAVSAVRERDKADEARRRAEKRLEEVGTIYEIGRAIDEVEHDRLLEMITAKAAAVMDAEACSLMLRDESGYLEIRASFGLSDDVVKGTHIGDGEGIAGRVAQTGEPMLLLDLSADPRFAGGDVTKRTDISSSICVPLKDKNGLVQGVLSIRRHKPSPSFTEGDMKLFSVFASQAALAITNAQLYGRLQKRIEEMGTVSDLVRTMNATLDLEAVLSMIADSIVSVVGFDRCCVYLHDPRNDELVAGIRRGYGGAAGEERVKVGQGLVGVAAKEQIPVFDEEPGTGSSMLAVPMVVRGDCIGAVLVDNRPSKRPMRQSSVDLLSTFVNQAGIAVENARLYEAMEQKYAELNMLFEHSRSIGAAYGLDQVSQMLMEAAIRAAQADGGMLLVLNERRNELAVKACLGSCINGCEKVEAVAMEEAAVDTVRGMRGPTLIRGRDKADQRRYRLFQPVLPRSGAVLAIPLVAEDATVGVLVTAKQKAEFEPGEVKLLSIVTSHAAAVIKNALNYEHRMQRKELELTALHEFSERISSASSLGDALDSILAMVGNIVECDESYIYALDQERGVLTPKAVRVAGGSRKKQPEEPIGGHALTSWAIQERKALLSPDISADPRFRLTSLGELPVKSLMSIPLMVQEEVVAVLNVYSYRPNLYSEDDVRVLSIVASQGAAIYKELEALSALTNYTDNILSSIAAGVVTLDSEGVILTWNKAAAGVMNRKPSHVVGLPYRELIEGLRIPKEEKTNAITVIEQVFHTGELFQGYKLCFHPEDKDELYLNMSVSTLVNSVGEQLGLVIIFEEVTREIKMENEFRKMGELAAVGQLAASIAHELRNPLSSIKGAAQLLREQYDDHLTIVEFLDIILEEVDALSKLTTEFLDFARPVELDLRRLDINNVVRKTLQLMALQINDSRVEVYEDLSADLPLINADEKQLEQVLRNIILNALQAMPSGGNIEISSAPLQGRREGVELTVKDTGTGIPQDKLERIFIPFFTTKTKGTGLGLSVVQKIVENHGGRVEVFSEAEEGTTFKLTFPEQSVSPLVQMREGDTKGRDQGELTPENETNKEVNERQQP